jgi:pimeloyl-ACP methyl ester carboxylesterase
MMKKKRVLVKRLMWVFIPAVLVLGFGSLLLDGYLIYSLAHPARTRLYGSPRDFQIILQKPMWSEEKWKNSDGTQSVGWFLNRGRPAPAIILSHSYGSNRSELLTLSFELWKAGYHVLLYDLRGHGESPVKWSGLGTYEKDDLLSAINFLKSMKSEAGQDLLDGRIGLYGVELGGYISLVAASENPMVKAVAVDSVYPSIAHFINYRLKLHSGENAMVDHLLDADLVSEITKLVMQVYLLRREDSAPALESVSVAAGRRLLFIVGKDSSALRGPTLTLYSKTVDQKQLAEVEQTRINRLYGKASADYDARVVEFFREAIPSSAPSARRSGTPTGFAAGAAAP